MPVAAPVVSVHETEILFSRPDSPLRASYAHQLWRPPTDLYETENEYVAQVEIAGMRHSDFSVAITERRITISGSRQDPGEPRAYYQMEIHYSEFRTDLELPGPIDVQAVQADYRDGFLRVVLPKLRD